MSGLFRALPTTAASLTQYGRSPAYRRIYSFQNALRNHPERWTIPAYARRSFHRQVRFLQQTQKEEVRDPPRPDEPSASASDSAKPSSEAESGQTSGKREQEDRSEESKEEGDKDGDKKRKEAPPPPHGNKSPLQVFMDTLKSEFQASKEWNEGTKQLGSRYSEFTQNEQLKRAREYTGAGRDAVTSATGKVLKGTGKAIGQSAAWTWDTLPMKGVRASVNATGRGVEKLTRPLRETEAFKSMSDVIDDGSSSRYGGWTEKEQRRQRREAREIQEAVRTGRPVRRQEPMEEDPE